MWPKLRSLVLLREQRRLGMHGGEPSSELVLEKHANNSMQSIINVNDEYKKALRTKSYVDVWTRIHRHLPRRSTTTIPRQLQQRIPSSTWEQQNDSTATCSTAAAVTLTPTGSLLAASSTPFSSYSHLSDYLLEPHNNVQALLCAVRQPNVRALFLDYFDATLQACTICGSLLHSIEQLRRERLILRRLVLGTAAAYSIDCIGHPAYVELESLLSSVETSQFCRVLDVYASLIRRLVLARDKVLKRARLARLVKRTLAVMLVFACGALATAVLVVGGNAVGFLAVALGPALVGPFSAWFRRRRRMGTGRLARLGEQLDAAARGAYIMSRDLETISRIVARLNNEVEHWKEVVRLFLRRGEGWVLQELAERGGGFLGDGVSEQLDELEEHVYWCLLTINRIRALVAREILAVDHASSYFASATPSSGTALHALREGKYLSAALRWV